MSRLLANEERALYTRFQDMLRQEDRVAFCQQLAVATVEQHESSFTYFGGTAAAPAFDTGIYRHNLIAAYYHDVDGQTVHVILHLAHGYVSWVERFRIDTSRLIHGRSKARVEMVVPPANDLRFVRERYALPPEADLGDGFPRLLTIREREMYGRFADALRTEDVAAFTAQIAIATITKQDSSHTSFGNIDTAPTFNAGWYEYLIGAFYDDVDSVTINMIFHFTDGGISWVERFRLDMQPVQLAVPRPKDLRFVMIKM